MKNKSNSPRRPIEQPLSIVTGQHVLSFLDNYNHALKQTHITEDEAFTQTFRDGVGGSYELNIQRTDRGRMKVWVKLPDPQYGGGGKGIKRYASAEDLNTLRRRIELTMLDARVESRRVRYAEMVYQGFQAISNGKGNITMREALRQGDEQGLTEVFAHMTVEQSEAWLKILGLWEVVEPLDSNTDPLSNARLVEASPEAIETFKRTGKPGITPIFSDEELDSMRVEVPVAERDDLGHVRPTAAYYTLNPLDGEIVAHKPDEAEHRVMGEVIMNNVGLKNVNQIVGKLRELVKQGQIWDWESIRGIAYEKSLASSTVNAEWKGGGGLLYALIGDVCTRMELEQKNDYYGEASYPYAHLVDPKMEMTLQEIAAAFPDEVVKGKKFYRAYCELSIITSGFVGLDQYRNAGAPTFTPICQRCLVKFESAPNIEERVNVEELAEKVSEGWVGMTQEEKLEEWGKKDDVVADVIHMKGFRVGSEVTQPQDTLFESIDEDDENIKGISGPCNTPGCPIHDPDNKVS